VEQVVSLPLGAVRLAERYGKSIRSSASTEKALCGAPIDQTIEDATESAVRGRHDDRQRRHASPISPRCPGRTRGKITTARDYQPEPRRRSRAWWRGCGRRRSKARRQIPGPESQRPTSSSAARRSSRAHALARHAAALLVNDRGVRDGVLLSMIDDMSG